VLGTSGHEWRRGGAESWGCHCFFDGSPVVVLPTLLVMVHRAKSFDIASIACCFLYSLMQGGFVALATTGEAPTGSGAASELMAAGDAMEDGDDDGAAGLRAPSASHGGGEGNATVVVVARAGAAAVGRRGAGAGSSHAGASLVPDKDELGMGLDGSTVLDAQGRRKAAKDARKKSRRASRGSGGMGDAAATAAASMDGGESGEQGGSDSAPRGEAYNFGEFFGDGSAGDAGEGAASMET